MGEVHRCEGMIVGRRMKWAPQPPPPERERGMELTIQKYFRGQKAELISRARE